MSRMINQPSNQIKLTNVSLVRLKKGKKRFEIACYKNKVLEWRSGIEKDLDEVLQIPNVFLNVSKGQTAPTADLEKAFGKKTTTDEIILEILNKGELQVGEKERAAQMDRVHNEVISIVASKLVDPRTKRVYTTGMIEKALDMLSQQAHQQQQQSSQGGNSATGSGTATPATGDDGEAKPIPSSKLREHTWTGVVTTKSAKSQALDAMKALIAHQPIPVTRARMRLRVTCTTSALKQAVKGDAAKSSTDAAEDGGAEQKAPGTVKDKILSYIEQIENQDMVGSEWEVVGFVEPGAFKGLSDFVGTHTKGQGRVEVLDMAVTHED
ncbi:SBDS protein C-terminal domain-containing protein [Microdochium trichocladiopsis]|uniref:Ribosome maturation protein SDO1 n=1 Tax=Microdochium trichocladiopsis TaxID=1682393 RepID=A0A9P9BWR8_9PEZI|nr:SBDS protein C-terminal domain-containing protein [Microdochium trichocladiopsis]KAH7041052.1 SBDS protein C-terminal domain-containing protein [Microdochium trichocladiopsis]